MIRKEITEGKAKLVVDETSFSDLPEHASVFYNPFMVFDRDISVEIVKKYFENKENVVGFDLLSATGVRGIRYLLESNVSFMYFNDISKEATEIIKENLKLNGLENKAKVFNDDANKVLNDEKFDFIDIDPFGAPSYFFENSVKKIKRNGLLMITATDRGAICGKFTKAGLRKYGVFLGKTSFPNDIALRAMVASANIHAFKFDKCVEPILCYSKRHFYRCYLVVREGSRYIKEAMKNLGFVKYNEKTDERDVYNYPNGFGPIWIGKLYNKNFLENINNDFIKNKILKEEDFLFYYDISYICKIYKLQMKKKKYLIEKLKDLGYKASETHLCNTGIKTNADLEIILDILRS